MHRSANLGEISTVDFHVDVMCPWACQTSQWMRDVRDQLDPDTVDEATADPTAVTAWIGGSEAAVGRR